MTVCIKTKPELVRAAGSHRLELGGLNEQQAGEVFSREELYPVLELEAPRVGKVRAQFSVDRYVSTAGLGDWRILLREVRTPDPEAPDSPHLGRLAAGIGDITRSAIRTACEPVIRKWLDSDGYKRARRKAAASTVRREFAKEPRAYNVTSARRALEAVDGAGELGPMEASHLRGILELLELVVDGLDREALAD